MEGKEKLFLHFCRIIFVHLGDEVGRFCSFKAITDFLGLFLLLCYKLHCNTFNVMTFNYVNVSGVTYFIKVNFLVWSIFAGSRKFLFRIWQTYWETETLYSSTNYWYIAASASNYPFFWKSLLVHFERYWPGF